MTTYSFLDTLKQINAVEGWLSSPEADLLTATTLKVLMELPGPHNIVEIGSYHGKSTIVLGNVLKYYSPDSVLTAIDPHAGIVGASDSGFHALPSSLTFFKNNITNAGLGDIVTLIKDYSYNVECLVTLSLLFIDGLHDYENVSRDFKHFEPSVCSGGYIAFHDYAPHCPGVMNFVSELLSSNKYLKMSNVDSLAVIKKLN